MRRGVLFAVAFAVGAGMGMGSRGAAQAQMAAALPVAEQIQLGHSVAALYGPWKFRVGDSPIDPKTGAPVWAEPGFDDAGWETVDLSGQSHASDPIAGTPDYMPGWTAKGHPGYWGYAWYRIRVNVTSRPGVKLAMAGPSDVDDVYQFFDNGTKVGAFGDFAPGKEPTVYTTRPVMFDLPEALGTSGTREFAFRVYMMPDTLTQLDDVGGFHNAPLLGEVGAIASRYQVQWEELYRAYASELIEGIIFAYRNGKPMGVEGSLPLGVLEEPEFTLLRFTLAEEDRLMLLSDGIAEAKDAAGRLFGFERVLDLVRTSRSAEDIAAEAQRFGQEDDISVIAVTRMAMGEPLPA
ncbi:MAG: SpoIIE family protein phosphatase [Acidobacteriaceae bacterium]